MRTLKKADSGFTLLEVLVTMIISSILISTVILNFISAKTNVVKNRNRIIALAHATSTIELLRNYVTADQAGPEYIEPWGGTKYALSAGEKGGVDQHVMPLTYEAPIYSPLVKRTPAWQRKYDVEDIECSTPINGVKLKKVTVTITP